MGSGTLQPPQEGSRGPQAAGVMAEGWGTWMGRGLAGLMACSGRAKGGWGWARAAGSAALYPHL